MTRPRRERRENLMFKGFYNLSSAMITHQNNLNVIANNMVNISTYGFKASRYTATTFDDVMYHRAGNKYQQPVEIGRQSYLRAASEIVVDHRQGVPEPTAIPLDFCIMGDGYFAIEAPDGNIAYTRTGNFSLDTEGYLWLQDIGRVLDREGAPIFLGTDKVVSDEDGTIRFETTGETMATLGVDAFEDTAALELNERGLFTGDGAALVEAPHVLGGYLERSNSDMVKQMTEMITFQRALQSAATVTKIYDQVMNRSTTEIGRM